MNTTEHDFGNNETHATGIATTPDGFLALTLTESKTFRTERGAASWLARRGYDSNGKKVSR